MIKAMIKVFRSVRDYKPYAIITPLFMVGETAVECTLPFFMSFFVGKIETITHIYELLPYFLILLALTAISITCGVMGGRFASIAASGFAKNLRNDLYEKIESFSFENIDRFQASSLVTRMTTDVGNAQMSFAMVLRIVIRAPLMLIFSAVMAFITGGQMAWLFIITIPVLGSVFVIIARFAMKYFRRVFKRYDD